MELLDRYELILHQALDELGSFELPSDSQALYELQASLAPRLGDILYRLSVEHGIEYTPFRETVIGLIAEAPEGADDGLQPQQPPLEFAPDLEEHHNLILLALEMMPADTPGM